MSVDPGFAKFMKITIAAALLLVPSLCIGQSWQETLEQNFDIVETFDDLQDWSLRGRS